MTTANVLTSFASSTDATSYVSSSITPAANHLVLMVVENRIISGTATQPTASGNGLTWVVEETITSGTGLGRLTLFRAMGASPTTGAVTVDFGGVTQTGCSAAIAEFDGVDTGGTNGSAAVVQSVSATGTASTSGSVTLAAFGSASNATFGSFVHFANETSTPGTGFTELVDIAHASPAMNLMAEWRTDNATTVDASWTTSQTWMGIGAEIKAAGGTTFPQSVSGTTTPAGGLVRQPNKVGSGSTSPAGIVTRSSSRFVSAALPTAGVLTKRPTKSFGGSVTPAASLSISRVVLVALSGVLSSGGTLVRQARKVIGGTVTPAGALRKAVSRSFAGSVSPAGLAGKLLARTLAGSTAPAGLVARLVRRILAGSTAPTGAVGTSVAGAVLVVAPHPIAFEHQERAMFHHQDR